VVTRPVTHHVHHRYVAVLVLILATLVFQLAAPDGSVSRVITVILHAATLIAAVVVSRSHVWLARIVIPICLVLVLIALFADRGAEEGETNAARLIALLLIALLPLVIVLGMREHFREQGGITLQTMFGVLCIYLLIGMLFSTVYGAIVSVSGDPFFTQGFPEDTSDYLYFSFSTLTTTGFGDLIAATDLGRSLSVTEALIGQIYLVTVVALIVSNLGPAQRARHQRDQAARSSSS